MLELRFYYNLKETWLFSISETARGIFHHEQKSFIASFNFLLFANNISHNNNKAMYLRESKSTKIKETIQNFWALVLFV